MLGSEALLYKVDISRAFRHIRIDPGDLDLLGLKHDQLFLDCTLPFEFHHGSFFFQRCTDAVRYIMSKKFNFPYLCNYIDLTGFQMKYIPLTLPLLLCYKN